MKSGTEGRTTEGPKGLQEFQDLSQGTQLKTNVANLVLPTKYYICWHASYFESKTACRKTYKKVSMSALHPSRKTSPPPSQRRQCCWGSTPEVQISNEGTYKGKEPQHLFLTNFQVAFSGLHVSSFNHATPNHLQKTGRQEGPAESLLGEHWGVSGCLIGSSLSGFRPNSKVWGAIYFKIRRTQKTVFLELRLKVKAVMLCGHDWGFQAGHVKLSCRTLDGASGNTGERTDLLFGNACKN